ncbi:MAG: nicotinate phosphoribosyltransferase [Anaerolineae bacterium]|nr:nicotinate phosphoribosyltransferase [Anaerolineae bacterium]
MKNSEQRIAEGFLFTDQYQLTMAQLYYRMGLHEKQVQFDHFFRKYPDYGLHQAGYCISAGLGWLLDWMQEVTITDAELDYLRSQTDRTNQPVFGEDFLGWLRDHGTFDSITLRAIPEGRVVHAQVPLTIVKGPLAVAQILETSLLNHINYQTLVATKAARIQQSGHGQLLLEFGLRRGQEKGANAGTRAALIGGADFSSNVGISHLLGYPPKGTHAHSMVQVFLALGMSEQDAFQAYADVYPDDCLLLVDTVDTLGSGVPHAIKVFEKLRKRGHQPVGIRLDSGDLAYLSVQAARLLNEAGFPDTTIVLSSDLDELAILQITAQIIQEARQYNMDADHMLKRLSYGVGTKLITSTGEAALGGVYKLVAVQDGDKWLPAIKISENPVKTPNPGNKNIWRLYDRRGLATVDLMSLEDEDPCTMDNFTIFHPADHSKSRQIVQANISEIEPLLITALDEGRPVYESPPIEVMRDQRRRDLARLDPGVKRIINPHRYHVSLTQPLWDLKQNLIKSVHQ